MGSLHLGPLTERAVNLCVDMQRLFSGEGPWATPWLNERLPVITEIAGRYPDRTVFTRFIPPFRPDDLPGMWQRYYRRWHNITREELDTGLLELVEPLARLAPPATVIDKLVYSPFSGPRPLLQHLRSRHCDALIVTGAETDVCVLATVLGAVDYGFRVIVVKDAICSSFDAGHDALLTLYEQRFTEQIEITDAEAVLSSWS
jgi:nicotinamidase-related amidase